MPEPGPPPASRAARLGDAVLAVPFAVRAVLVGLAGAVLVAIIFHAQLFGGQTFPWDFLATYTTSPPFVGATIGHGHFDSWNPYVASGFPSAVNPQAGLYFPIWWLLGALRIPITIGAVTGVQVAHVFLAGVGVAALCRARRVGWAWAILAGVAYVFFGGFYGEAEHADIVRGFAYLPWLLWSLTPPRTGGRWWRLASVPLWAWLILTGAYPGDAVSYAIVGLAYLATGIWVDRPEDRRALIVAMACAAVACAAIALATLLPYQHADSHGEIVRVILPTEAARAAGSLSPRDLLGSYLNTFAWQTDGTITSWAIGVPILVGLAGLRGRIIRRQLPLVVSGLLGLALAMTPAIKPIGSVMVSLGDLFPSRFPAADYKAMIAVAIIVLSIEGWRDLVARPRTESRLTGLFAVAVAAALVVGLECARHPDAALTRLGWLLIVVAAASAVLALWRPPAWIAVPILLVLVIADGYREIGGYHNDQGVSSWSTPYRDDPELEARDAVVRTLAHELAHPPTARPARIGPAAPLAVYPGGSPPDSYGWSGDGYHFDDYGDDLEKPLYESERDPVLADILLAPWRAYAFSCATVGCRTGHVHLPAPARWRVDPAITTSSYGIHGIVYDVTVRRPVLMVENELAIPGWRSDSSKVTPVGTDLPFRAWRLAAGTYSFRETYAQPEAGAQEVAVVLAALAWLALLASLSGRLHAIRLPRRRARAAVA